MAGVGIKILVGDTTGSNRAGKEKRRQTKTRKRTRKKRRRATVWRTEGMARGAGGPRGGAPGVERLKRGAPEAGGLREGVPEAGRPASWLLSVSLSLLVSWSACWRVFALARQVFALTACF